MEQTGIITRAQEEAILQKLKEEYENPPISELDEQRVWDGLTYVRERGWSIRKAAKKAGITDKRLGR